MSAFFVFVKYCAARMQSYNEILLVKYAKSPINNL